MANNFVKQEVVMFEKVLEGFTDALVISKMFSRFDVDGATAERANNVVWVPQPFVAMSFTGIDQTANFNRQYTELSVPITLSYNHVVPYTLGAGELRDGRVYDKIAKAAKIKLASDVNVACSTLAAMSGTLVVKRNSAATGFDDVAQLDNAFNRVGVPMGERIACFASGDYNSMASNLGGRVLDNKKSLAAYEKAYVGEVAGFDTFKLDYGYRLTAAAATGVTINGANQRYVPKATSTAGTGETSNVDNRYQNISITVTSGTVKQGDAFTIAGVNEVHHITKQDTGSLKTFRVAGIVSGGGGTGVITISPPIIAADSSPVDAEVQYKNVTATPANGAQVTFLNTVSSVVSPFWHADAFQLVPGLYKPAENSGMNMMTGTTDQGLTVLMSRQGDINKLDTKYRFDVFYGMANVQPQMSGIELFNQT